MTVKRRVKYRIHEGILDKEGAIYRLEKDGKNREEISRAIHEATRDASPQEARELANRLYKRD